MPWFPCRAKEIAQKQSKEFGISIKYIIAHSDESKGLSSLQDKSTRNFLSSLGISTLEIQSIVIPQTHSKSVERIQRSKKLLVAS